MDIKRAIDLLQKALSELPELHTFSLGNKEFELWHDKVLDILEETFGKSSTEWERFARAVSVYLPTYTKAEENKEYNRLLNEYETALKSIIQKYDILGTEEKSHSGSKLSILYKIWYEIKDFVAAIIAKFIAEKTK